MDSPKKKCFVIGPFGDDGSEMKTHADTLLHEVILPCLQEHYDVERADKNRISGNISDRMIENIYTWDLAIGDLTYHNPNALYEIALRHAAEKPLVLFRTPKWPIPFNVTDQRAITADIFTAAGLQQARNELREHVQEINKDGFRVTNPVTRVFGLRELRVNGDSKDQIIAGLEERVAKHEQLLQDVVDSLVEMQEQRRKTVAEALGEARARAKLMARGIPMHAYGDKPEPGHELVGNFDQQTFNGLLTGIPMPQERRQGIDAGTDKSE